MTDDLFPIESAGTGPSSKPYPDFPLSYHVSGQWYKTIPAAKAHVRDGRVYFGRAKYPDDWRAALALYEKEKDAWERGENARAIIAALQIESTGEVVPSRKPDGTPTLALLVRLFLDAMDLRRHEVDEFTRRPKLSTANYLHKKSVLKRLVDHFGADRDLVSISPEEWRQFKISLQRKHKLGPAAMNHHITFVRQMARWCWDNRKLTLLKEPVEFGQDFGRYADAQMEIHRQRQELAHGVKIWTPANVQTILDACDPISRAMFLLSINCGFTSKDVAWLPFELIDWKREAIFFFPRPKTTRQRILPLWPETIEAIKLALEKRPAPKDGEELVWQCPVTLRQWKAKDMLFITKFGRVWWRELADRETDPTASGKNDAVTYRFKREIFKDLGPDMNKPGKGFGTGRPTFRSAISDHPDREAKLWVMGHKQAGMDGHYLKATKAALDSIRQVVDLARERLLLDSQRVRVTDFMYGPLLLPWDGKGCRSVGEEDDFEGEVVLSQSKSDGKTR